MGSDPLSAYKSTQVETASQEQILLMLYDGLIKYIKQAKEGIEENDYELVHNKLVKSQDIVTELMSSLDQEIGGEIAEELFALYEYVLHNLVQANVEKDSSFLDEALPILEELQETWDEVINEKGITVEKARKNLQGQDQTEDGSESSESDQSSQVDQSSPISNSGQGNQDPIDPSQSVTYSDHTFEG